MKKIFITFLMFISLHSFSQRNEINISMPLMNFVYVGFDNVLKVNFSKKIIKNYILECSECDTIYKSDFFKNEWIIRVDTVKTISLIVKNKRSKTLNITKIKAIQPPKPKVYFDSVSSQSILTKLPKKIVLKLDKYVPLMMGFSIIKWTIKIDEMVFLGYGNKISKEVIDSMILNKKGFLNIEIIYRDVYGVKNIKEIIEFKFE